LTSLNFTEEKGTSVGQGSNSLDQEK